MNAARISDGFASVWLTFWLMFLAVYIHFGGLAFAGLCILLGAVGWPIWVLHRREVPLMDRSVIVPSVAFALFFTWLTLSGTWGPFGPDTALRLGAQVLFMAALPALFVTRTAWCKTVLGQILMAISVAGVVIIAMDVASGYGINTFLYSDGADVDLNLRQGAAEMNIGRGHVIYAVMTPLILALFATGLPRKRAWIAAVVFTAIILIGTLLNRLAIAPVIMLIAAPFIFIGYKSPTWGLRLSLGTLAASILFAPIIGVLSRLAGEGLMSHLPMSWDHRLRMWDHSLTLISESPWIGHGLESSRTFGDSFTTRIGVDVPFISLHPHNIGLQTWLEAGLIGAVLLTIAIVSLHRPLQRLIQGHAWRGAAISGLLMGIAVASAVTVGAWQYWWWGLIGLSLSLVTLIPTVLSLKPSDMVDTPS